MRRSSDKRYWSNEVGSAAHMSNARSAYAKQNVDDARAEVPAAAPRTKVHIYQGGPKTGSWSFR